MKCRTLHSLSFLIALLIGSTMTAQEPAEKILAGWPGVFPEGGMYLRYFENPKNAKEAWQQTVRYEWSGGRIETVRVTLLRDAGEAKKYQFDAKNPLPETV